MHSFLSVMRVLAQKDDRTTVAGKHGSAQQLEKLKMPHCGTCPMLTCMKVHWLFCDFEPRSWSTRCLSTVAASTLLPRVGTDGQTRWAVAQKMMTTKYSGYCCRFAPIECIESYWIQLNHIFACASLCIRVFLHHYQATVFVWFIPDLHHCCLLWCSVLQPPGTSWHLGPVRSKTYCKYINSLYSLFIALIE